MMRHIPIALSFALVVSAVWPSAASGAERLALVGGVVIGVRFLVFELR